MQPYQIWIFLLHNKLALCVIKLRMEQDLISVDYWTSRMILVMSIF